MTELLQTERVLVNNETNPPTYGDEDLLCHRPGGQCQECSESCYQPVYHCRGCQHLEYRIADEE